jgi:hypothetical protein
MIYSNNNNHHPISMCCLCEFGGNNEVLRVGCSNATVLRSLISKFSPQKRKLDLVVCPNIWLCTAGYSIQNWESKILRCYQRLRYM